MDLKYTKENFDKLQKEIKRLNFKLELEENKHKLYIENNNNDTYIKNHKEYIKNRDIDLTKNNNTTNTEKKNNYLLNSIPKNPTPILLIIDNFYNNPYETRKNVLTQEFQIRGNYPGQRTLSCATQEMRDRIQKWVYPFGGKITHFPMEKNDSNYNGAFQYTTSRDRSWFHVDSWNNWAGVLYLTPDAPVNSGTGLYKYKDGTRFDYEQDLMDNKDEINNATQDITKWELVDKVGNIFNRLVLFNANSFHCSMDYFGHNKENGRLFQVFFFSTEKQNC